MIVFGMMKILEENIKKIKILTLAHIFDLFNCKEHHLVMLENKLFLADTPYTPPTHRMSEHTFKCN